MQLIKLNAIDSTNDYLKRIVVAQLVENFTVVTAQTQTNGRGQMGAKWVSQSGKNLVMSVLIKDLLTDVNQIFDLNVAIALSITQALEKFDIPKLSVKWPNDIMSDHKKMGGILIENSIKSDGKIVSIVGIGLNVNQTDFTDLPKASSMAVVSNREFDKESVLVEIVKEIKRNVAQLQISDHELWQKYIATLFKKDIPMPFENLSGERFMGMIQGVSKDGKLLLLLENDSVKSFGIKEIQMLY